MAFERNVNVQDVFLNHARKNKTQLSVFLINGVKLQGILVWFDQHTLLLKRDGGVQLVYKHAVSTLIPQGYFPFLDYRGGDQVATNQPLQEEVVQQD